MDHDDDRSVPRRGPGRPARPKEPSDPNAPTVKVTYHPLDPGDAAEVEWHGFKFQANVAKDVATSHHDLIEAAKGNPWFSVEGSPRAKRVRPQAEPITPPGRDVDPVALDDRKMVEDD